jgi:hypothetical protein
MCIFLCAKPNPHEWIDQILARVERQARQQFFSLHPEQSASLHAAGVISQENESAACEIDRAIPEFVNSRFEYLALRRALPHERHKPLNALANAWSRLLILVGWRR